MKNKVLLLTIIILFSGNFAIAQNIFVIPGSRVGSDSGVVSISSGESFIVSSLPDRSTYCRQRSPGVGVDWSLDPAITCPELPTCISGNMVGDMEAAVDVLSTSNDAISFIADYIEGEPSFDYLYSINVFNVSPSPSNVIIECFDTTLYGNFNTVTAANPFNFLELSNDASKDLIARIVVTGNTGTVLSRTNVTIPAGQQRDIAVHDIAGASNTFGRVTVAHTGALHSLRAKLTKYTSSFAITASEKFETRANEL